jgi:uncharacterized protein HemX
MLRRFDVNKRVCHAPVGALILGAGASTAAAGAVGTMAVTSALAIGSGLYAADKQRSAQKKATAAQVAAQKKADETQERLRREQEAEARRIAMEEKPEELSATLEIAGTDKLAKKRQATADFLVPLQSTLGASKGGSGLGFKV